MLCHLLFHTKQGDSAADREAAAFSLQAGELRLFGVSCLGGALDASATLLQVHCHCAVCVSVWFVACSVRLFDHDLVSLQRSLALCLPGGGLLPQHLLQSIRSTNACALFLFRRPMVWCCGKEAAAAAAVMAAGAAAAGGTRPAPPPAAGPWPASALHWRLSKQAQRKERCCCHVAATLASTSCTCSGKSFRPAVLSLLLLLFFLFASAPS